VGIGVVAVNETFNDDTSVDVTSYMFIDTSEWEPGEGPLPGPHDRPQVVELAELLPRVAALASYVNSDACGDQDRERLRDMVPAGTYFLLLLNLANLRSEFARQRRQVTLQSGRLTVDLLTFFEEYQASDGMGRP
jgi:hypothetical protein